MLFITVFLSLTNLGIAHAYPPAADLEQSDEVFESETLSSGKYSCKSCINIYRVYPTIGKRVYQYSFYKVFYDGKYHSSSEHFDSSGKCSAAYDSDFRCRN
jgi:hypothetical protein